LINSQQKRNWEKISNLIENLRNLEKENDRSSLTKKFDKIGDVALFHSLPTDQSLDELQNMAREYILNRNKAINIVVARTGTLHSSSRSPNNLVLLASRHRNRSIAPLLTTHVEYGVKCVIDIQNTFFSPRMSFERKRICDQVKQNEKILFLFSGCGMEAFLIAAKTLSMNTTIHMIENNPFAIRCAQRTLQMLCKKMTFNETQIKIFQEDVFQICPSLPLQYYDRILAPRPKEVNYAPHLQDNYDNLEAISGIPFLKLLLPLLKLNTGICHWYDFVPFHELPHCQRTKSYIESVIHNKSQDLDILHIAKVGSVAMKQFRVCIDFRIIQK